MQFFPFSIDYVIKSQVVWFITVQKMFIFQCVFLSLLLDNSKIKAVSMLLNNYQKVMFF